MKLRIEQAVPVDTTVEVKFLELAYDLDPTTHTCVFTVEAINNLVSELNSRGVRTTIE
jgi:hypothetical protein